MGEFFSRSIAFSIICFSYFLVLAIIYDSVYIRRLFRNTSAITELRVLL